MVRRITALLIVAALLHAGSLARVDRADACSCGGFPTSDAHVRQELARWDAAIIGRIIESDFDGTSYPNSNRTIQVVVEQSFKGASPDDAFHVYGFEVGDCGFGVGSVGAQQFIFLRGDRAHYTTSGCRSFEVIDPVVAEREHRVIRLEFLAALANVAAPIVANRDEPTSRELQSQALAAAAAAAMVVIGVSGMAWTLRRR